MPIIDGEKWACQSCIKGHRVSGCQHKERELFHINPKGRPVKQCEHCRSTRKSKAHHVKCDCGDKKDKSHHKSKDGENATCCGCNTGNKCVCGMKKDSPLKLETETSEHHPSLPKTKPRLTTAQSESTLTVFANGHHKPCHRNNNSAHTSGLPYKIPRPHTLHGPTAFSAHHSRDNSNSFYGMPGQRSVDALQMPDSSLFSQPSDSIPMTPISNSVDDDFAFNPMNYGFNNTALSMPPVESANSSPVEPQASEVFGAQQWNWTNGFDTTNNGQFALGNLSQSPPNEYMSNDNDWAIPSAGLNPSWEAVDLPLHPERLSNTFQQIPSHCGESRASVPGLSTSSSQSEVGETAFFGEFEAKVGQTLGTDNSWDSAHQFRKPRQVRGISNASTPPDLRQAPTSAPTPESHARNRASLDIDFLRRTSPPVAAELENNFMTSRPISVAGLETVSPGSNTSSAQFVTPSDLDSLDFSDNGLPRSMTMPATIDESSETVSNWPAFLPLTSDSGIQGTTAPFDNGNVAEMPGYAWNDIFT